MKTTVDQLGQELSKGQYVISTSDDAFGFLLGEVISIEQVGTPCHNPDNPYDNVEVDFTRFKYREHRKAEIEDTFSILFGYYRPFEELPLGGVIMEPNELMVITPGEVMLGTNEVLIGHSKEIAECFCKLKEAVFKSIINQLNQEE